MKTNATQVLTTWIKLFVTFTCFLLIFSNTGRSQAVVKDPVCYGEPIELICNATSACNNFDATFHWENFSGSWTSSERNPVINPGQPGYATDWFYLNIDYSPPPGGFYTGSIHVTVNPLQPVSLTITASSNPAILGSPVTFTAHPVNGGTTPAYQWKKNGTNVSGATNSTYNYIPANNDAVACTLTSNAACATGNPATSNTITMVVLPGMTLTSAVNGATCKGVANGSINLTVSGGTPPYAYFWSNAATTEDIINLFAGTYTVTVTDSYSSVKTGSWTVNEPGALSWASSKTNVTCNGLCDGSIATLYTLGGTPPYTYHWSNGATTQNLAGLCPGTYSVTVSDAHLCDVRGFSTITQPEAISMGANLVAVSCNGMGNGSIDLSVSGGTFPYSYVWSNGATTGYIGNLFSGTYSVTVSDGYNCTATGNWTVSEPAGLSWDCTKTNVTCKGACDGTISTSVMMGGTAPYAYHWSNGANTDNLTGLCQGTYSVTVTDANLCNIITYRTITAPDALALSASTVAASCPAASDGSINLSVSGGTLPYSYFWSNSSTTEDISGLAAGSYSVTVIDAHYCLKTGSFAVGQTSSVCALTYLQNQFVSDSRCYNATQTIYVAGPPPSNPTSFYVLSGGHVTLIAGQNILFYPGTKAVAGSYLHGSINPGGPWCSMKEATMITVPDGEPETPAAGEKSFFTVYPNPTSGQFTLELKNIEESATVRVEIYGLYGERLQSADLSGQMKYNLSLAGKPIGVYFLRVVSGNLAGTGKIIKQ